MHKTPEIFFIENATQPYIFENICNEFETLDSWRWQKPCPHDKPFDIEDDTFFWITDIKKNNWSEPIFLDIIEQLNILDPNTKNYNFKLNWAYGAAKTQGLDGTIHVDKQFEFNEQNEGYMTFVYYPMKEWNVEWGGELQFFDDKGNIVTTFIPKPNTAIIFDSNLMHRSLAPRKKDIVKHFITYKTFVNKF